jgi:hypothetical protein
MLETWRLFHAALDAKPLNAKKLALAMGLKPSTISYYGRRPADGDDPEGTGAPNPCDRMEGFVAACASVPQGRSVVRMVQAWFNRVCDDALSAGHTEPLTAGSHAQHLAALLKEFGECVAAAGALDTPEAVEKLAREWADVRVAGDDFVRAAQAGAQ